MKALTAAIFLGLLLLGGDALAKPPKPYAFEDIRLGMTLDEFRATRPPGEIRVFCSNETLPAEVESPLAFKLSPEMMGADAIRCAMFGRNKDGRFVALPVLVVGVPSTFWPLFIKISGKTSQYQLAQINFSLSMQARNGIVRAFTNTYGQPAEADVSGTRWTNHVSEIVATDPGKTAGEFEVFFIHLALQKEFGERLDAAKKNPPAKR